MVQTIGKITKDIKNHISFEPRGRGLGTSSPPLLLSAPENNKSGEGAWFWSVALDIYNIYTPRTIKYFCISIFCDVN